MVNSEQRKVKKMMEKITRLTRVLCMVLVLVLLMLGTLVACRKEEQEGKNQKSDFMFIQDSYGGYIAHVARAPGEILRLYPDSYILYVAPLDGGMDEEMVGVLVSKNTDSNDPDWLTDILEGRKTGDQVIVDIASGTEPVSEVHPRLYEAGRVIHLRGDVGDTTGPIVYEGDVLHVAKATGKIAEAYPDSYILYLAPEPGTTWSEEVLQILVTKDTVWDNESTWEYLLKVSHSGKKLRVSCTRGFSTPDPLYFSLYCAEKVETIDEEQ